MTISLRCFYYFSTLAILFFFISLDSAFCQKNEDTDPLHVELTKFKSEISTNENFEVILKLSLPEGYHAYEDKFIFDLLEPSGFKISSIKISPLKTWFDKFSKKQRTGIEKESSLSFIIEAPDFNQTHQIHQTKTEDARTNKHEVNELMFELTYQACSEKFCLFPKKKSIKIPVRWKDSADPSVNNEVKPDQTSLSDMSTTSKNLTTIKNSGDFFSIENFNVLLKQSWLLALIVTFIAGILTSFTPCIFPMIPITLAILNNHSEKRTRLTNFLISLVYVHGIATTYSLLGIFAALSGNIFGSLFSNPYVLALVCLIFLVMSFSMYGAFEIQVPHFIQNKFSSGSKKTGYLGAYLSGLFAGIVASPCVGPVLVSILTFVSTQKSILFGFFLLFSYAMGLGLIFLFLGASTELTKKLPRTGPWMNFMKFVLGTMMLFAFYYYLQFLMPLRLFHFCLGVGLVSIGSLYGAFAPVIHLKKRDFLKKGFMQAVLVIGFIYISFGVFDLDTVLYKTLTSRSVELSDDGHRWEMYSEEKLVTAKSIQQAVIIDFYADWCAACLELDKDVFQTKEFMEATKNTLLLKVDATKDSAMLDQIKSKFDIKGLPTIIFINKKGEWLKSFTLTEFENKEKFLKRLEQTL